MLLSSSPLSFSCSTPSRSSYYSARSNQPVNSSPLASPSYSSPTHEAQERRRAQYKSMASASYRSPVNLASAKLLFRSGSQTSEDPQKNFLRERFQARCREHARKLRDRAVNSRRSSDKCSDVFMDCDDEEESDDVIMQDELFRRIMQSTNHKKSHSYRVSYAIEVGSSFDPDMEDASAWESELQGKFKQKPSSTEPTPDDLEEEEVLEYAEQYTALADFADLDLAIDDLTALSDTEDIPPDVPRQTFQPQDVCQTSEMDVS
ncbi:hypothetical protein J3R83DRAFT_10675 [Lanmaoa asiatica]|nr:hypothetical protein J3R83DRAFT_10675 [Lanmaoa asiatica]